MFLMLVKGEDMPVVCVSGYFLTGPHKGHIELFQKAKQLAGPGGKVVAIINNDAQCILKKGKIILDENERLVIIQAIRYIDEAFISIDTDRTVCKSLRLAHEKHNVTVFCQGGDRSNGEIPETPVCQELGIQQIDGLGDKIQSSTAITGITSLLTRV